MRPAWSDAILGSPVVESMAATMARGGSLHVSGMQGSSPSVLAWAAHERSGRPMLVLVAHVDEADEVAAEWESLGAPVQVLSPLEFGARDAAALAESMLARVHLARTVLSSDRSPLVVVASIAAAMQALPAPEAIDGLLRTVRAGERVGQASLLAWPSQARPATHAWPWRSSRASSRCAVAWSMSSGSGARCPCDWTSSATISSGFTRSMWPRRPPIEPCRRHRSSRPRLRHRRETRPGHRSATRSPARHGHCC